MKLTCNLYVDGDFEGKIHSDKQINIGKQGHIKGDIITQRLVVQGLIEGTINAQRIEIKAGGKVSGNIESAELIIEAKGIFEGMSVVKSLDPLSHKMSEKFQEIE